MIISSRILPRAAAAALFLLGCGLLACDFEADGEEVTPAGETSSLETLLDAYETIRLALLSDHLEGVEQAAGEIQRAAEALAADMSADAAGVSADRLSEVEALLPPLITAAKELAMAGDLTAARASFWSLTEPLLEYRELAGNDARRVAYCPMVQKSWIQPDGDIGNPYYGQSMATCGGFVENEEEG